MANLLGQDIGLNYKGLINIGSTINQNISASLQSLTDGNGNLLPLQISTTQMSVGDATGTGRLIVRGDGTNPVARFEAADGTNILTVPATAANTSVLLFRGFYMGFNNNSGTLIGIENGSFLFYSGSNRFVVGSTGIVTLYNSITTANTLPTFTLSTGVALTSANSSRFVFSNTGSVTVTSGTSSGINFTDTFAAAAGSANYRPLSINYTINNSGAQTGSTTGIYLNATETALNGMTHNLMDLQVGGVSAFRVDRIGNTALGTITSNSWTMQFTDSGTGFLLLRGANRFKVFAAGGAAVMSSFVVGYDLSGVTGLPRLTVRGDGTNPIARFEGSAGTAAYVINAAGNVHTFTGEVSASDNVTIAATRSFFITSRGGISSPLDGVFLLRNNTSSDFNRLQFGGSTNSFPSIKKSSTILQARLADDSDFTFIQGKLRTETNFTNDPAVSASGYLILYDLDGTAYKVLATAL